MGAVMGRKPEKLISFDMEHLTEIESISETNWQITEANIIIEILII